MSAGEEVHNVQPGHPGAADKGGGVTQDLFNRRGGGYGDFRISGGGGGWGGFTRILGTGIPPPFVLTS